MTLTGILIELYNSQKSPYCESRKTLGKILGSFAASNFTIEFSLGIFEEMHFRKLSQPAFTCSKLTIETLEQGVTYVEN